MVAKLETIRKKIRSKKKLGFSERARAVSKGLLPSKAKKNGNKKNIMLHFRLDISNFINLSRI